MDKKNKSHGSEDMKGFEEFIEGQTSEKRFLPRPTLSGNKKENSFEFFTFLTTDAVRLTKLKNLLNEKLPFAAKYEQGNVLIKEQREEIQSLKKQLLEFSNEKGSPYRKSVEEIFDSFFDPHDPNH